MSEPSSRPRILFVDSAGLFPGLRERLVARGYEVSPSEAVEAISLVESEPPTMVILGGPPEGPAADLLAALRRIRDRDSFVPVIVLLDEGDVASRIRAFREGADECLKSPIVEDELVVRIEALLRIKGIQDRMHRSRQQLQRFSTNDALTGVLNRQHFEGRLREELWRAKRYHDPLALLVLDLDGFRHVNENSGEEIGSEILRAFAQQITAAVRDVDLAARLSADTFCLLLPQTHLSGALTVAERVRKSVVSTPFHVRGASVPMTVSIGIAFFPSREVSSPEDLLRLAREALYQVRKQGSGRVGLYQGTHYAYQDGQGSDESGAGGPDEGTSGVKKN